MNLIVGDRAKSLKNCLFLLLAFSVFIQIPSFAQDRPKFDEEVGKGLGDTPVLHPGEYLEMEEDKANADSQKFGNIEINSQVGSAITSGCELVEGPKFDAEVGKGVCNIPNLHPGEYLERSVFGDPGDQVVCPLPSGYFDQVDKKYEKEFLKIELGDSIFELTGRLRIDSVYGVNLNLLNNANNNDRDCLRMRDFQTCDGCPQLDKVIWPGRNTFDLYFLYTYGKPSKGYEVVKSRFGVRNRYIWGDEFSVLPTSRSRIQHVDAQLGDHSHFITRQMFWARELWVEMSVNDIFCLDTDHRHTLMFGIFPFSLGRGISLGDAYAVDPEFLGFYTTSAIDQFAPGIKLSGELVAPCVLNYDLYFEVLNNSSDSFSQINQSIYSQRFGRRFIPQRGFGHLDYIVASRLLWKPTNKPGEKVQIEPYGLLLSTKDQTIEFESDSEVLFGTLGLAGEFEYGSFEAGFDTAFNIGQQKVFGWDRNVVTEENREGFDVFVYNKVLDGMPGSDPRPKRALLTPENRRIVNRYRQECNAVNGQEIVVREEGKCVNTGLFNAVDRFSNPYTNDLRGAMFVYDMAYNFPQKVKIAATAGFATGDLPPNKDIQSRGESDVDKTFKGFVSLQELYAGKRVRSLFVLAGQGNIPRVAAVPGEDIINDEPATTTSKFTNLILTGTGITCLPKFNDIPVTINGNMLAFWVWRRPEVLSSIRNVSTSELVTPRRDARPFLGVELNLILEAEILKDLRFTVNGALFLPGPFYTDLAGTPLNREQREFLQSIATPNEDSPVRRVPTLGNDPGYFVSCYFEYLF